jgi:hypothetical protein
MNSSISFDAILYVLETHTTWVGRFASNWLQKYRQADAEVQRETDELMKEYGGVGRWNFLYVYFYNSKNSSPLPSRTVVMKFFLLTTLLVYISFITLFSGVLRKYHWLRENRLGYIA